MVIPCSRCGNEIDEGMTILVAVTDPSLGALLTEVFSTAGMKVFSAEEPREIFSLLESTRPRMAVLDPALPRLMGMEVSEIIHRSPRFREVQIIPVAVPPEVPSAQVSADSFPEPPGAFPEGDKVEKGKPSGGLTPEEEILHQEARKLARIIVSDIVLYNPEKVEEGVRNGTFFPLLKDDIEEGRRYYRERTPPSVTAVRDYFENALAEYIEKKSQSRSLISWP